MTKRSKSTTAVLGAIGVLGLVAAGCGSKKSASAASQATQTSSKLAAASPVAYHPKIEPARFVPRVTNRYFPLTPGATMIYTGTKDGAPERVEVKVLRKTKSVLGVRCAVISDVVTSNYSLVEKTTDWYAQDTSGNVWYFGEDSKEYKNGAVTSTKGTWEAGVDGAQPGIIIHAKPRPGPAYRQEYRPGVAEDMGKVLTVAGKVRVPLGTFHPVVVTFDTDPLNPDKLEHKWYAPKIGLVRAVRVGGGHHEQIRLASLKNV